MLCIETNVNIRWVLIEFREIDAVKVLSTGERSQLESSCMPSDNYIVIAAYQIISVLKTVYHVIVPMLLDLKI